MQEISPFYDEEKTMSTEAPVLTIEKADQSMVVDEKGKPDGLRWGKLMEETRGGLAIKARSTIKFVFQILIGILIYSVVLASLMIVKNHFPLYAQALMIFMAFCGFGIGISITLYLFYPHIAPRIFDLHHGFFYTKPLSFYIHIVAWDSVHTNITALHLIQAIQIIRKENGVETLDQTNLILQNGRRIPLMIQRNAVLEHIREDAQKLATRLVVPVWDMGILTR